MKSLDSNMNKKSKKKKEEEVELSSKTSQEIAINNTLINVLVI